MVVATILVVVTVAVVLASSIVVPMFPPPPLPLAPPPDGRCFRPRCGRCLRSCCHLPAAMVITCCSAKVYFSWHLLARKTILVRRHAAMARGTPICVSAYLRICGQQNHKKNKK
jgi:hypothetical protein